MSWGDLSFTFGRRGGQFALDVWWLGERGHAFPERPDVGAPADPTPSGLRTEDGVGIGDSADPVDGAGVYRDPFDDDERRELITVASTEGGGFYVVEDGLIIRLGLESACR